MRKNAIRTLILGEYYVILHSEYIIVGLMKKFIVLSAVIATLILTGCATEFNNVYKTDDWSFKYEYAKEAYARQQYTRAATLFGDMIHIMKGTDHGEECLFLDAMANYNNKDYEAASEIFKKYVTSYPKGIYVEYASFYIGESLYLSSPEARLDQSPTYSAMRAYQDFMDRYPYSELKERAQAKLYELQDKLVYKELLSARLYFNLGTYFGNCSSNDNNYDACIITAQNALKEYPYTSLREDFAVLIMKSKFELAEQSVDSKRMERFQDAEDECYGFINEYPDSKERGTAEKYISRCKKVTKDAPTE